MKTTIVVLSLTILFFFNGLYAQTQISEEDLIKGSSYIFEGKVVKTTPFRNSEQQLMVSFLLKVKSNLNQSKKIHIGDTVELISVAPLGWELLEDGSLLINHIYHPFFEQQGLNLGNGTQAVFFCKDNELKTTSIETNNYSQLISFSPNSNAFFHLSPVTYIDPTSNEEFIESCEIRGFDRVFHSIDEFNSFLNTFGLVSIKSKIDNDN